MKNKNTMITKEEKEYCSYQLQKYSEENFEEPLSALQSFLLVDFIENNFGKFFYNKGIEDSIVEMKDKVDDLYLLIKQ